MAVLRLGLSGEPSVLKMLTNDSALWLVRDDC
jgi:hypothetical protein